MKLLHACLLIGSPLCACLISAYKGCADVALVWAVCCLYALLTAYTYNCLGACVDLMDAQSHVLDEYRRLWTRRGASHDDGPTGRV